MAYILHHELACMHAISDKGGNKYSEAFPLALACYVLFLVSSLHETFYVDIDLIIYCIVKISSTGTQLQP